MKPFPNDEPPSALVLHYEVRVVGNLIDFEVFGEESQESFRVPEGRIQELSEEGGDEESAFVRRRSSCRLFMLPKRESVGVFSNRFDAQFDPVAMMSS